MFKFFKQSSQKSSPALFDESFLLRLERLAFRTAPDLRGGMIGEQRSRNLRLATDFRDHRPYTSGDDFRYVDWNAYGRHKELLVKLGETTQQIDLHILLDASPSMGWTLSDHHLKNDKADWSPTSKWDMARRLTGALGYLGLADGVRVTITPFAQTLGEQFGPSHGKRQVTRSLNYLTNMSPMPHDGSAQETDLSTVLLRYARAYPRGGVLLLLSDMLDTVSDEGDFNKGLEDLSEGLRHMSPPRWQVMVLHLLSTMEVQPDLTGEFDFEDIETKQNLPFRINQATLAEYRLRVRRWCTELQSVCSRRGAIYSQVLAEWPLEQKIVPYLRLRQVLK